MSLSYDRADGLYGGASASAVIGSDEAIEPLGVQVSAGYARRLRSGSVVDVGIVHSSYSRYSSRGSSGYTEVYAGFSRKALSARIAYAPHYFERGASTLYGEVDANFSPARKLSLYGHVGVLVPLGYSRELDGQYRQLDWRVGVARQVGRASLHAFLTGGGPGRDYYRDRPRDRTRLVFGVSCPL